jgi:UDP-N-acetylmuramate dehydrogenase
MNTDHSFEESLREKVPLAPFTTLGIGGPARYFAEAASERALAAGVRFARARALPLFILGGGSNIVVADGGWPGLVLRVAIRGIQTSVKGDEVTLTAGAGEEWDPLVALSVANDWAGLECLSGIPGRVGATPIQNVGAYGQDTSESLLRIEALDLETCEMVEMSAGQCEFGYRTSRFKTRDRDRFVITGVTYLLKSGGSPAVRYAELERYLAASGTGDPGLKEVREAVLAIRRRKAMVIDPADADSRSVGSFFVNPVIDREELPEIAERARRLAPSEVAMPTFPAPENRVKLPAAWLIERAGFYRGFTHGNVGISSKHALAIVNRGGGNAREVIELADMIRARVLDCFGVRLTPEPLFIGFDE